MKANDRTPPVYTPSSRTVPERPGRRGRRLAAASDVWEAERALWELPQEHFIVYDLDVRHRVIERRLISIGTATGVEVHPRDVFRGAIVSNAAALILVHNHPSGDPAPSQADRSLTVRLQYVAEMIGIKILDHVIVAAQGYISFEDMGLLPRGLA